MKLNLVNQDGGLEKSKDAKSRGNPRCTKPDHSETFIGSDGFTRCKDCRREYYRKWAKNHPEYVAAQRRYNVQYRAKPEYRKRTRVQHNAHNRAGYHKDRLKKDYCESCGLSIDLHMHHNDYSKPLEVVTLCRTCHEAVHHKLGGVFCMNKDKTKSVSTVPGIPWEQFKGSRPDTTITISATAIHVPHKMFVYLGQPDAANLYFDRDKKRIWIQPDSKEGTNKLNKGKGSYYYISTKISKELPLGWYKYVTPTQDTDGSIWEFECPSPKRHTKLTDLELKDD